MPGLPAAPGAPPSAQPRDPKAPESYRQAKRAGKAAKAAVRANKGGLSEKKPVRYPDGVTVKVRRMKAGAEKATGPGSFPDRSFVSFALALENGSAKPLDLNTVVVSATYGSPARLAAPVYDSESAADFAGTVAPGESASATYNFAIPKGERGDVSVIVDFDSTHAAAELDGEAR